MRKTKSKKNILYIMAGIIIVGIALVIVNFISAFNLKTKNMSLYRGEWIDVYYENEAEAARDVFDYAEKEIVQVVQKLGFQEKQEVRVFIYDEQKVMQTKKYGLIGPMLGLDWYIGDNIGTDVILTSPANPGLVHSYENNKYAVLHEIVHAYISVMNPDIRLWLTEGCALYLANGDEFSKEYLEYMKIPSFQDTRSNNPIRFADCDGYTFSHTYIEYIDKTYGWDKVLQLIQTEDYKTIFSKTELEIYEEWVDYIKNYNN